MHWSSYLQKAHRPLQTRYHEYRELAPLSGRNMILNTKERPRAKKRCVDELQKMFACLKKWDYDDLPCMAYREALQHCLQENLDHIEGQRKRMENPENQNLHISSEDSSVQEFSHRLTLAEANALFKKYQQPDLGTHPYNVQKRLPHQPYSEDHFGKKKRAGSKS